MDYEKIIEAISGVIGKVSPAVGAGIEVVKAAKVIYDAIGRDEDDISEEDLELMALESDALHDEVQKPIPDEK